MQILQNSFMSDHMKQANIMPNQQSISGDDASFFEQIRDNIIQEENKSKDPNYINVDK